MMKKLSLTFIALLAVTSSNVSANSKQCLKTILGDSDLEATTREAVDICKTHTLRQVMCAKEMDNDGLENDFKQALKNCSILPREIECVKTIMSDVDLEKSGSRGAREMCQDNSFQTIRCAQKLDNDGLENSFGVAIKACQDQSKVKCIRTILSDKDLENRGSLDAKNICTKYTYNEVLCAKDLDNQGLENNFSVALRACVGASGYIQEPVTWEDNYTPAQPVSHQDTLGFHFRDRAIMIASTVVSVSKNIEKYLTNEQENKVDEIKKQAIRLRSRINGGASLKTVRNTLYHLGVLLNESSSFIDNILETDSLDHFAEDMMTSTESISTMVDFLDNDYKGAKADLY